MEVGLVLVGMGSVGRQELTAALASTNSKVRGAAALALGLDDSGDPRVVRRLLEALDRGCVDCHVLGAIGRLGGDPDEVAPFVSRALLRMPGPSPCSVEARMLACLEGLCGPRTVGALSALERQREYCSESHRQIVERTTRRIGSPVPPGAGGTGRWD